MVERVGFKAGFRLLTGAGLMIGSLLLIWASQPHLSSPPISTAPYDSDDRESSASPRARAALPTPETLPQLARIALEHYFATGDLPPAPDPIPDSWQRSHGVFVTLSHQGRTRGCWGTLQSVSPDLAQATIHAAIGSATRDPRYPPLRAAELPEISIQVALVKQVSPIRSMDEIDPTQSGIFVRSGSQGGVLLPGEALTSEWQIATARRWAGIPQQVPVEMFRVEAQVLHEHGLTAMARPPQDQDVERLNSALVEDGSVRE